MVDAGKQERQSFGLQSLRQVRGAVPCAAPTVRRPVPAFELAAALRHYLKTERRILGE